MPPSFFPQTCSRATLQGRHSSSPAAWKVACCGTLMRLTQASYSGKLQGHSCCFYAKNSMSDRFGPYQKLLKRAHQIALVSTAAEALNWDLETSMPPKALAFRAEQLAHFGGTKHRIFTAKSTGEWISACEQHGFAPDSPEAANVREWRRLYDRATKISPSLVEKFERTRAHARAAWKEARNKSEFKIFRPHLEKLVDLNRRRADSWGFSETPY